MVLKVKNKLCETIAEEKPKKFRRESYEKLF